MPVHGPSWVARPSQAKTWYLGMSSTNSTVPANANGASAAAGSGRASPMRTSTASAVIRAIRRAETETFMRFLLRSAWQGADHPGAQTKRRGDAGPVRNLPNGQGLTSRQNDSLVRDCRAHGSGQQRVRAGDVRVAGGGLVARDVVHREGVEVHQGVGCDVQPTAETQAGARLL